MAGQGTRPGLNLQLDPASLLHPGNAGPYGLAAIAANWISGATALGVRARRKFL